MSVEDTGPMPAKSHRPGVPHLRFILRQATEIRSGGLRSLAEKFAWLLTALPALFIVLGARVLSPVVLVRFGALVSHRIGHFAYDTEVYLCNRDEDVHRRRTIDIFHHVTPVSNQQLKKMWDRKLRVSRFSAWPYRVANRLPGHKSHIVPIPAVPSLEVSSLLASTATHLSFTPEEEQFGQARLRDMGVPESSAFICFQSRDSAYLDTAMPNGDWRYHNYRDSSIDTYIPAVEELTKRGYFAIRMGSIVKDPLKTSNPMIIDYATNGPTDFLDIYLSAKCQFALSDTVGSHCVPMVFRRPMAVVNFICLLSMAVEGPDFLLAPKKLWLRDERRFLTFREILNSSIARFQRSDLYEKSGIDVIDNTPEEIAAVVVEMDERLKGSWRTFEEDEQLQTQFWSLFKPSDLPRANLSRVGSEFLRKNQDLLV